jgi:hypothetical protein
VPSPPISATRTSQKAARSASRCAGAPRGDAVLRDRIVAIAGEDGLRCTIGYAALGRLGMTYRRRQREALAAWIGVTEAILAELDS